MPITDVRQLLNTGNSDKPALIYKGQTYTYGGLDDIAERLSAGLSRQLRPGALLAIWLPNTPELICLYVACLRCGVVPMPLHKDMRWPEVLRALTHARASAVVVSEHLLPSPHDIADTDIEHLFILEEKSESVLERPWPVGLVSSGGHHPPPADADAPGFVLQTSGSSGQPKGVVLSYRNLNHILRLRLQLTSLNAESVVVVGSCLTQSVGLHQALAMLAAGGQIVLLDGYEVDIFAEAIERYAPTHLMMVVNAFDKLLDHPSISADSFRNVVFASAGADMITLKLQKRYIELTGKPLHVSYGMTESSWAIMNLEERIDKALALGKPSPDVQIRLVDDRGRVLTHAHEGIGEIQISSPRNMLGYLNDEELTKSAFVDDWLPSGDLATQDDDGYYWFAGRKKHLIVLNSGDNVAPAEVERAILSHQEVVGCLVVSGQSKIDGSEVPLAYVIRQGETLSEEALRTYLDSQLSYFKIPTRIHFVAELPTGLTGKLLRPPYSVHADSSGNRLDENCDTNATS